MEIVFAHSTSAFEDQRPCGKVMWSSNVIGLVAWRLSGPRPPETTEEAQKEAPDGTQKRTKGNPEEVMSQILRGDVLRLGRLFARGSAPPSV